MENIDKSIIKNVVFDVGDVLLSYRWKAMLMDFGLDEEQAVRVGNEIFDDDEQLWSKFDLGYISTDELIEKYSMKYPDDKEAITFFIAHGEFMHVARPKVWKLVREIKKAGYNTYILSNYSEDLFNKHTMYADFLDDMDGILVSYMVNKAKPDAAIYKALCDRFNLDASECLFFDDRLCNVSGAIDFGMQSVQVLSQEGLIEDLKELLEEK